MKHHVVEVQHHVLFKSRGKCRRRKVVVGTSPSLTTDLGCEDVFQLLMALALVLLPASLYSHLDISVLFMLYSSRSYPGVLIVGVIVVLFSFFAQVSFIVDHKPWAQGGRCSSNDSGPASTPLPLQDEVSPPPP